VYSLRFAFNSIQRNHEYVCIQYVRRRSCPVSEVCSTDHLESKYLISRCLFLDAKSGYALVNPASTAVTCSSSWLGHIPFRPRLIAYPSWRTRSYLITSTTRRYNILYFFQALIGFRPWPAGVTTFLVHGHIRFRSRLAGIVSCLVRVS